MRILLLSCAVLAAVHLSAGNYNEAANEAWQTYWSQYGSMYDNGVSEAYTRLFYNYNRRVIDKLNANLNRTKGAYTLDENQFTGMRYRQFKALFPLTRSGEYNGIKMDPLDFPAEPPAISFDPATELGFTYAVPIENQGMKCNSGWAYAVAKAIELWEVVNSNDTTLGGYSAQRFIDCAGSATSCKSQTPQTAFNYMTVNSQFLYNTADYPNRPQSAVPGMCAVPAAALSEISLTSYSCIENGDEATIKRALVNGHPVVVEVDPKSFEFMHYSNGVFQQPAKKKEVGSHFMVAIGYGIDADSNLPYWTLVNSFGKSWGMDGLMRLDRNTPIKTACFPYE